MDRAKYTLVMSFGLFSTLFLKVKSETLPAGNSWIINKARFRNFSMNKKTPNFSPVFSNSPQMFFTLERLSWKALILPDASSIQKSYTSIFEKYAILVLIMHLPGNNSVAIAIVRRD